jgi:hypothetical protein
VNILTKFRRRWRLGAVLALVATVAVAYSLPGQASADTSRVPQFSAVQLADGVLFHVGPAAEYLKALGPQPDPWT